jgi:tetratricopeptide (TPR) repeat protein
MKAARSAPVAAVVALLSVLTSASGRAAGVSAEQLEGIRLYEAGQFAEAIPHFDQVLKRHPRDLDILHRRGICYLRTDQPEKALADFERINRRSAGFARSFITGFLPAAAGVPEPLPNLWYAESYGNQGIALLMLGRDQEALDSFREAARLWSLLGRNAPQRGVASAYQGIGQSYQRLGQNAAGVEAYTRAIQLDASDANGFAGRAGILAEQGLFDQALSDYTEAIRLDSTNARALAGRGIVLFQLGRDEPALVDLDRAISLDPKFARAYSYRGAAHARRGQNAQAFADYDALIKLMPENAGAYKDRGGVLVRLGRFREAILDLDTAIRLAPKRASAYQNRGAAYSSLGQYERAIDDFTEAIRLDAESAGAHSNRGLAYFAIGEYDQALADLSRAIQLQPREALTHFNRAEVFDRLEIRERALADYTEAIRLAPRLAPAYAAIGRIQAQLGRRDEAMHDFDMALRLDPQSAGVHLDRANARREAGDWLGALADYDRAIASDPRRADAYVARGWARLGAGIDWADNDARVYLKLRGWRDSLSPYMAMLAVLGARGEAREAAARRLLDEALANNPRGAWPAPLLRYFQGRLTESELLRSAAGTRQQIEVHAFLGLERLRAGDRAAAISHLRFARIHGLAGSIAADTAKTTLARIESNP